jgi:integral membrane sensor domain MASE1
MALWLPVAMVVHAASRMNGNSWPGTLKSMLAKLLAYH